MELPTAAEISKVRTMYFNKEEYKHVFEKLPRVAEIFEVIELAKGPRDAMLHLHSAFLLVNHINFLKLANTVLQTGPLGFDLAQTLARYLYMVSDLDPGHMISLTRAIQDDGKDVVKDMFK